MSAGAPSATAERRVLDCGDRAVLVETADLAGALALALALRADPPVGLVDVVPGARTVLVRFLPELVERSALVRALASLRATAGALPRGRTVEIGVRYDGPDLDEVAATTGLPAEEVVRRHTASEHLVAFAGFAPGFVYCSGGDPAIAVPRRAVPRTRVPAGAVGLAGGFTGVYPRESPGGWQLIGRTGATMWDLDRTPAALLQPGDRVRFVDVGAAGVAGRRSRAQERPAPDARDDRTAPDPDGAALEVLATGVQAVLQDDGRPGLAALGVGPSGAADPTSLHLANRLVGNAARTAAVEAAGGGLAVRARGELVVAVAGAPAPVTVIRRFGRTERVERPRAVPLGHDDELVVGEPSGGIRDYLAVRGGFAVEEVLGSRSTDTISGLGPPPLAPGDVLPVRSAAGARSVAHPDRWRDLPDGPALLPVRLGPRDDRFTPRALALLEEQVWTVTPRSNRSGIRLAGSSALERTVLDELPSEGAVAGALQVPPDGQPILFLQDHPLTGGYPVIAVVHAAALGRAGQLAAGAVVRFRIDRGQEPACGAC